MLIVAENRPEWCVADLAVLGAGAVTVPAYTTNTTDDPRLPAHGPRETKAVICSGHQLAKRLLPAVAQAPSARFVLFMDPIEDVGALPVSALSWADALALGREAAPPDRSGKLPRTTSLA